MGMLLDRRGWTNPICVNSLFQKSFVQSYLDQLRHNGVSRGHWNPGLAESLPRYLLCQSRWTSTGIKHTLSQSTHVSKIASEKSYLDMEAFTLHRKRRGNQADIGSYSCNDQLLLPCVPNSFCKSWIVPCIDNSLSLDALLVRLGRGLLDHAQEQALYIGFPKALIVSFKRGFQIPNSLHG
jgi:hypothetical protein